MPSNSSPATSGYRPDIDGLRAIAVLLVVLFHFGLPEFLRSGFVGVDIFFVISGYLIIPPIIERVQSRQFSFGEFYERRIRRLAPALLATTLLTFAAGLLLLTPFELIGLAKEAISSQLYVSNIYYWRYLNYFGVQANGAFLLHTWSLGVEEQFYLTFPFMLWASAKVAPRHLVYLLLLVGAASFLLDLVATGWKPEASFYLLPTRAWEFVAGAMVPYAACFTRRSRLASYAAIFAGLLLLGLTLALYKSTIPFPGWFALLPVASSFALLSAGADPRNIWSRLMSWPAIVYVGRISYELYLVHWPIKIFLPLVVQEVSVLARIVALALCFVLAAAIFHLVEAPVRRRRVFRSGTALARSYAAATAALVALFGISLATSGLPQRFSAQVNSIAAGASDQDARFRGCEGKGDAPCKIGRAGTQPAWLIYGDSHADALAGAFSSFLSSRQSGGYFAFQSACLPVIGAGDEPCREFNRKIERFIAAHPEVRHVVLVSTWRAPIDTGYVDENGRLLRGAPAEAAFDRSLDKTISTVGRRADVIIWLPVPGGRSSVPGTLARNLIWGRHWPLEFTRSEYDEQFAYLTRALARHSDLRFIDPARILCRTGSCQVADRGRSLYYDNAHPAASARPFFQQIIGNSLAAVH